MESFLNNLETFNEIDYVRTLLSFFCCIVLSFSLKFIYQEKSISLSNKSHISNILPLLSLVTFLVILIVKSSLALSLGLVGALSIVRFRTPIKEPEELIYLFLAISIGLGYGAGQIIPTTIICIIIFIIIWFFVGNQFNKVSSEYNLIISCDKEDRNNNQVSNTYIFENLKSFFKEFELIKYEINENNKVTFIIKVMMENINNFDEFQTKLSKELKNLEVNYYFANPVY
tara:strand:+ start:9395 stop:10081 length:687 start_codon:yes stop_codon:yes gene_type:complete